MPASRSAAATTLAPRSCPSRPGFATSTRIGRINDWSGASDGAENWRRSPSKLALAASAGQRTGDRGLARDEQHLARSTLQRSRRKALERLFDDETDVGAQLGQSRWRVQSDGVLTVSGAVGTGPRRVHGQFP